MRHHTHTDANDKTSSKGATLSSVSQITSTIVKVAAPNSLNGYVLITPKRRWKDGVDKVDLHRFWRDNHKTAQTDLELRYYYSRHKPFLVGVCPPRETIIQCGQSSNQHARTHTHTTSSQVCRLYRKKKKKMRLPLAVAAGQLQQLYSVPRAFHSVSWLLLHSPSVPFSHPPHSVPPLSPSTSAG